MSNRIIPANQIYRLALAALLALTARAAAQDETPPSSIPPDVEHRIARAFGSDSAEARRPIRIWLTKKRLVITASESQINDAGTQVVLKDFSTAQFSDTRGDKVISWTRGQSAVLQLDRAIKNIQDLGDGAIQSIEVQYAANFSSTFLAPDVTMPRAGLGLEPPTRPSSAQAAEPKLFKFAIDPQTPVGKLLPTPPKTASRLPHWTNEYLANVPEVAFGEPLSPKVSKEKALEETAHLLAKVNFVNERQTDGFIRALVRERSDLRGLPFLMGQQCRMPHEQAKVFDLVANTAHQMLREPMGDGPAQSTFMASMVLAQVAASEADIDMIHRALVAAFMQIQMADPPNGRIGLARFLAGIPHADATRALAKLAIFSPEKEVRAAAVEGLKTRRERDYTDLLLQAFDYPLPAVAKAAAAALVELERTDVADRLVDILERPDPRLPVKEKRYGKDVHVVRELVRINHHRNCVLCHAPGNTETTPDGVLTVAVPLPTEPLPKPSEKGYRSTPPASPDIVVRIDMTYLRQDFAVMMPVSDAHPWPDMQRFDFLVRTRELTPSEAENCKLGEQEPGRLSPYRRAALFALRELTGRDGEPTADAWRKMLKLPAR